MKPILFLSLVLVTFSSYANNYYISAAGNNANNGLTPATSWKTIAKLNASFSVILPGDSILFKSGEVFYGSVVVGKSGTSSLPIIISSYGAGAKPVISGFTMLTGWTNISGNIWQCTPSVTLKKNVNILTINGTPYAVGRTPNSTYYSYQAASATQLTSTSLTTLYIGAEIVMKKNSYTAEKAKITAQAGGTVTYIPTLPIDNNQVLAASKGTANFGFFLQRFAGSLDQHGEWFYDAVAQTMKIYSNANPSVNIMKASCIDTVILLGNKAYITITNLSIEGGGMYGIESYGGSNIIIKSCDFNNNTKAVYVWNTSQTTVDNCTINNSFNGAILVSNNQRKQINITNNTIKNTGQLIGMGLFWSNYNLKGIVARTDTTRAANFVNIKGNKLYNTGHAGIEFQGTNVTVSKNIVDTFCNQLDDNGGIYTFTNNTSSTSLNYTNRLIDSNFILNGIGSPEGANNIIDLAGYYMDDQTSNVIGTNNTIANIPGNGVQMNNPSNQVFMHNTVYNCSFNLAITKKPFSVMSNNLIKKNTLYQKDSSQLNFFHVNSNLASPTSMFITQSLTTQWNMDSNYVSNMKQEGYGYYYSSDGNTYTFPPHLTLLQWQNTYLHDKHSLLPPVTATPTNTRMEYNATSTPKTISLGGRYLGVDSTIYDGSITLAPYTSAVLLKGIAPPALLANAGNDVILSLPVNTTTLKGSTSTPVIGYSWTKLSGPSQYKIADSNSATTQIDNLTTGTYTFQLKVTNSAGVVAVSNINVMVLNTLPATLIDFSAKNNINNTKLKWQMSSDVNIDHYKIERSSTGNNFVNIGKINSNNLIGIQSNYKFVDKFPLKGTSYYRLVMAGKDGKINYSNPILVSIKNASSFSISSLALSSVNKSIQVGLYSSTSQVVNLVVADVSGRILFASPVQLQKGFSMIEKKIPALHTGVYYIKIYNSYQFITKAVLTN